MVCGAAQHAAAADARLAAGEAARASARCCCAACTSSARESPGGRAGCWAGADSSRVHELPPSRSSAPIRGRHGSGLNETAIRGARATPQAARARRLRRLRSRRARPSRSPGSFDRLAVARPRHDLRAGRPAFLQRSAANGSRRHSSIRRPGARPSTPRAQERRPSPSRSARIRASRRRSPSASSINHRCRRYEPSPFRARRPVASRSPGMAGRTTACGLRRGSTR